jgi:hypothetical protein
VAQEGSDRLPALVLESQRRHREPGAVGEEGDDGVRVAALDRRGEAADQLTLAGGPRKGRALEAARPEALAERSPRPLERALDRRLGAVEHLRHLGGAKAEHVAEHERRALARRQVLQRRHECERDRLPRLVACLRPGRRVGETLEQRIRIGLEPDRLHHPGGLGRVEHRRDLLRTASAGAERVQGAVRRDPVQPGAQGGAALEAVESTPGGQQRLLHRVLGVLQRAEHPVAVELQLAAVPDDQLPEGVLVAAHR